MTFKVFGKNGSIRMESRDRIWLIRCVLCTIDEKNVKPDSCVAAGLIWQTDRGRHLTDLDLELEGRLEMEMLDDQVNVDID